MKRPCLDCGALTTQTRCRFCAAKRMARRNADPSRDIYRKGWSSYSRKRRAEEGFCAVCGSPDDLTVDHPTDAVLCRRCHARLEQSRRHA